MDPQSHDQAPPPSSHTLRSLTTSFLGEPHTPPKLQDDNLGTHSSLLVATDARCKACDLELLVGSMVDLLQEEVLPPGPAHTLPPDPDPSSSTCSQLYDFLPEEQLAATKQELRTILVVPQSHDQAPPPSLHTPHSRASPPSPSSTPGSPPYTGWSPSTGSYWPRTSALHQTSPHSSTRSTACSA